MRAHAARTRGRGLALAALLTVAAALVTACATTGPTSGAPSGGASPTPDPSAEPTGAPTATPSITEPLVPFTAPEVLAFCPAQRAVHLDLDPAAISEVYVCATESFEQLVDPGGSTGLDPDGAPAERAPVQRASRVTSGADELLEAYAVPNEPASTGACIALAADPLLVWVATADGITPVYAPVDGCGQPTAEASAAYRALELSTLVELPA